MFDIGLLKTYLPPLFGSSNCPWWASGLLWCPKPEIMTNYHELHCYDFFSCRRPNKYWRNVLQNIKSVQNSTDAFSSV